jgi:hypothetical protein
MARHLIMAAVLILTLIVLGIIPFAFWDKWGEMILVYFTAVPAAFTLNLKTIYLLYGRSVPESPAQDEQPEDPG